MDMFKLISVRLIVAVSFCLTMLLAGCGNDSSHHASDNTTQMGGAIQGEELVLTGETSTLIGGEALMEEGYRTSVTIDSPYGITSDGENLYVTEMLNNTIRKIAFASGEVTTLAGVAGASGSDDSSDGLAKFSMPLGITTDGTNVYVCDGGNNTIRQVELATGFVSTIAGSADNSGSADGTGAEARFNNPNSIATDGINLYVTDVRNDTIRQVVIATGVVTTLAGSPGNAGSTDGSGTAARFNNPNGIALAGGNLYVADTSNNTIRKIVIASAEVTTLAGSAGSAGSSDGSGFAARFNSPRGISLEGSDLYVTDSGNNTIRKVSTATAEVTTPAGVPQESGANGGIDTEARFYAPRGIMAVGSDLYVAGYMNNLIRKVDISTPENTVTTFAGFISHQFDEITTDGSYLFISDSSTHTIQKFEIATGEMSTLTGCFGVSGSIDGNDSVALFDSPAGVTTEGTNLYVAEYNDHTIRKVVIETGEVSTLAGRAGNSGSADGIGSTAEFDSPFGLTTDGTNLYVADMLNQTIRQIEIATGEVTTLAGSTGNSGSADGFGTDARFNYPLGITANGTNLYVADFYNSAIRQIVIATGEVTTLTLAQSEAVDGSVSPVLIDAPTGITTDGLNLYVTDSANNTVRKVVIATGVVTTVAGNAESSGSTDGPASVALFNTPTGITTDGKILYVLDSTGKILRSIR
jgi:sugar lactone lactonase YvrE